MNIYLRIGISIIVALIVQTIGVRVFSFSIVYLDAFLLVVVYFAAKEGLLTGILVGAISGLVQDSFSGGIIGIHGFAKTLVGFAVGLLSTILIMENLVAQALLLGLATLLNGAVIIGINYLFFHSPLKGFWGTMSFQCLGNIGVGVVIFQSAKFYNLVKERRLTS